MEVATFYDGNWLLHRAESVAGKFSAVPEKRIPILVLTWFCAYAIRLHATHGALCFDGGDNFRHYLYSGYKASRKESSSTERAETGSSKSDKTYALLQPTVSLFELANLPVFQNPSLEADDLVAAGAFAFTRDGEKKYRPGRKAFIVSPDKDLLPRVDKQVQIYVPESRAGKRQEVFYDVAEVIKVRGMRPRQFSDYQTMIGDATDDIPAVIQPAKAKAILDEYGSLKQYLATSEGRKFFLKHGSELLRNRRLVTMAHLAWKPSDEEIQLRPTSKNDPEILEHYGAIPASLTALRALLSPNKKGLF